MRATQMLTGYCWPLLTLWILSVAASVQSKSKDRLILSALFLTGALGANYMTMIAQYYPERCLCTTILCLILAIAILLPAVKTRLFSIILCILLLPVFSVRVYKGVADIAVCHNASVHRENTISQAKYEGNWDITLDVITCRTQYSPFWDLRDLSCETWDTWPNSSMAKYYGVDTIIGME